MALGPIGGALALVGGLRAFADDAPDPLVVEWSAPTEVCPGRNAVEERVNELLGGAPKPTPKPLTARGTVTSKGSGKSARYELSLELARDGRTSTRKLESSSCDSVADAGALIIALAFDPEAVHAAQAAPPASAPPPVASAPPLPSASAAPPASASPSASAPLPSASAPLPSASAPLPSASAPPPSASAAPVAPPQIAPWVPPPSTSSSGPRFGVEVSAAFDGDYGSLPGFSPGFRGGIGLVIDTYRIEPVVEGWPTATATLAANSAVGATFTLFAGGLRVCRQVLPWHRYTTSVLSLSGCVDAEIGYESATGFGLPKTASSGALWGALGAEAEGRVALPGPLGLDLGLGFVVPFDPRPFVVNTPDRDVVFTPAPLAGRFSGGVDLRF